MAFTFFTDLEKNIDAMVVDIVATISNNAMDYFLPVVSSGLAMSFIWFGTMCVLGNYDAPASDFIKKNSCYHHCGWDCWSGGIISNRNNEYYLRASI